MRVALLALIGAFPVRVLAGVEPPPLPEMPPDFLKAWGEFGNGPGQFSWAQGIAIDQTGIVYVVDQGNARVQKFGAFSSFIAQWRPAPGTPEMFQDPSGIAVDQQGYVYVADICRIRKFTSDGVVVSAWGNPDTCDLSVFGLTTDDSNYVYGVDYGRGRILKFTSDGTLGRSWGRPGAGPGEFNSPFGIAVSPDGFVYVGDSGNARVQKFTRNGTFVSMWGRRGDANGQFSGQPMWIAVDLDSKVYVTDWTRIQKFTGSGTFLSTWGSSGQGPGEFKGVGAIAVSPGYDIYVFDMQNERVQVFRYSMPTPTLTNTWGRIKNAYR